MQPRLEVEDGYAPSSEDYKTSILLIELFHHIFFVAHNPMCQRDCLLVRSHQKVIAIPTNAVVLPTTVRAFYDLVELRRVELRSKTNTC